MPVAFDNYRGLLLLLLLGVSTLMTAQLRYPIVGTYQKKSAQGMAIWGDYAYLFNDGGHCRVLNLKTEIVEREFDLASSGKSTHANVACFGGQYVRDNNIPVLYITEYNLPSRCFVESINDENSILVQTIQIMKEGKPVFVQAWIPDGENQFLYAIARTVPDKWQKHSKRVRISKYRLPSLLDGEQIVFEEKDCLESFFVDFASGTQGGVIKGHNLYMPTGLQESARGAVNAKRALQVIDLRKKKLVKKRDLTYVTTNEPEDLDFYGKKPLLYCGQEGGLYEIKL